MKYLTFIILICLLIISCDEEVTKVSDEIIYEYSTETNIPPSLKEIPIGLEVVNDPDTIYATKNPKDTNQYIWKLKTTIMAPMSDVKIIEFGDYEKMKDNTWQLHNFTNKIFTEKEFSEWYFINNNGEFSWENAEDGTIKKGIEYIDPSNWTKRSDTLCHQKGIWYFIGTDSNGKKVLGYAEYENIGELSKQ
ncbi:MAG: hypothetical protein ABIJ97_07995 [Bacteroidota bacterium]